MNIRLAQLKLFNVWSYDGGNPGEKRLASGAKFGVMTMPVGKPRTADSIYLRVSVYFKTHFFGIFFPYLSITTSVLCFGTMLTTKFYNSIQTMDKITPYKLFNTKFNIALNAFLTRAQSFHVNVGVGEYWDTHSN